MSDSKIKKSSRHRFLHYGFSVALFGLIGLAALEGIARALEHKPTGEARLVDDPILGWLPKPNTAGTMVSKEFEAVYTINELGMNDDPVFPLGQSDYRILVVGDSHTFAIGVDEQDVWPNQYEKLLRRSGASNAVVYNGGVTGYSLGQYLNRLKMLDRILDADLLLVGFSMATDLYDLIPPERGGFVYGLQDRVYYDLDEAGRIIEKNSKGIMRQATFGNEMGVRHFINIKRILQNHSAAYRLLKRSKLAMWMAVRFRPEGKSLWPGLDTALKISLSADDDYRWRLAEAIIVEMGRYARSVGKPIAIVNIPYLAQIYDDVWDSSFGGVPDLYDRHIGSRRLGEICSRHGIVYIDTTQEFIDVARRRDRWLHHRSDAHPTADGHELIARVVHAALVE